MEYELTVHIMSELKVHASACENVPMVQIEDLRAAFVSRLKKAVAEKEIPEWGAGARLAKMAGVTPKATSKWLNGESMPGGAKMLAVAEGDEVELAGGVLVHDAYRPGKVGDEVWIAHYDIRGALGGGEVAHDYPEMLQDVRVSPSQLRAMGVEFVEHYHLKMITGWGQSMTPTIKHGDPLLVDISIKEFVGDGIYFFSYQGFQYIKRLQMKGKDKFKMISDNRKHKAEDIFIDETYIQARVLLVWNANLV